MDLISQQLHELALFTTSRSDAFRLSYEALGQLFGQSPATMRRAVHKLDPVLDYSLVADRDYLLASSVSVGTRRDVPPWLLDSVKTMVRALAGPHARVGTGLPLTELWPLAEAEFSSCVTNAAEAEALGTVFDHFGCHNFRTPAGPTPWAKVRLASTPEALAGLAPGAAALRRFELGAWAGPTPSAGHLLVIAVVTILCWLAVPLVLLRLAIAAAWRANPEVKVAARDLAQTLTDDAHLMRASWVQAEYWRDVRKARHHALWLFLPAVWSKSPLHSIRGLECFLFLQSHKRFDQGIALLLDLIVPLARRLGRAHLAEALLHRAVLRYTCGAFAKAMVDHSEVDYLLAPGHHPFDYATNLSAVIRCCVVLKIPKLSAALRRKIDVLGDRISGPTLRRARLCAIVQWLREDGAATYDLELAALITEALVLPALPRASTLLLAATAKYELMQYQEASELLALAIDALASGHLLYHYRRVLRIMRLPSNPRVSPMRRGVGRLLTAVSGWRRLLDPAEKIGEATVIPPASWHKVAVQFRIVALLERSDLAMFHVSRSILAAATVTDLLTICAGVFDRLLPEFRYLIEAGSHRQGSTPQPAHVFADVAPRVELSGAAVAQTASRRLANGCVWYYVSASFADPDLRITVGAAMLEDAKELPRLDLAQQIVAFFCQTASCLALQENRNKFREAAAIARTTQMLAHDVRKPFSLLRLGLAAIDAAADANAADPQKVLSLAQALVPEVDRAMASVEGMLGDIMELGSLAPLKLVPESLMELLMTAVTQVFRYTDGKGLSLSYHLRHQWMPQIDQSRALRAVINILDNARVAAGEHGEIWMASKYVTETSQPQKGWIEIIIGNTGSYIPPEEQALIFEPFFTKRKAGGTGLGLAIAKKVIADHGGRLWCRSSRDEGTEFGFRLPASNVLEQGQVADLPATAAAVTFRPELAVQLRPSRGVDRALKVVVIDDDPFILDAWESCLGADRIEKYGDPTAAFAYLSQLPEDAGVACVVTDFHFFETTLAEGTNGGDLARRLRASGFKLPIILSSDAELSAETSSWFDGVLPKSQISRQAIVAAIDRSKRGHVGRGRQGG